jgi:adenosine deaminase
MGVLCEEQDFYDLTYAYLAKAHSQTVLYAELFFDPQAHTSRGVAFATVIRGIHRAQWAAAETLGIQSQLIMCFLRDMSVESAQLTLEQSIPFRDWIIGVGLDSDEKNNPPLKFAGVFAQARALGYRLTMHCDVNQDDNVQHIRDCVHSVQVDRIDHGVNALEDAELCEAIRERGLGLTVCPVSNRFVVQSLTSHEIRDMLARGMKVTVNSDDPAYFRAYLNENFIALQQEGGFSRDELLQLARNAFEVSWLSAAQRAGYLQQLDAYAGLALV